MTNKCTCPCCGYKTISSDGDYDICPICFWEDDPFQKENVYDLGANNIPLIEAQKNYLKFGVSEKQFIDNVRKPNKQDKREPNWKLIKDDLYELKSACRKFIKGIYNIGDLENNLSSIIVPEEITDLIKQAKQDLEMIRFCTSDFKQREEGLELVNTLLKRLNITVEMDNEF
jgi:hypothetical protein